MPITNYTELQAAVASWLNRTDLTTDIPNFIALAEANIKRSLGDALHSVFSLTNITTDPYTLPATLEAVEYVARSDGPGGVNNLPLDLLTFEDYRSLMQSNPAVRSPVYGVYVQHNVSGQETKLYFYPPVSASNAIANLIIEGALRLQPLATASTNPLLADAPDIYLYASLMEAAPFLEHDERIPVWEKRLEKGLKDYKVQIERRRFGGAPRRLKLPRVF